MTRGFITLAVGRDSYYELAHNLLMSYRKTNKARYPWTLVCDRENKWTADFDNIILLENPTFSYMDKLTLFGLTAYSESIFIDADCLVFDNIETLWTHMDKVDGFSCFGHALSPDSKDGWFLPDEIGEWKNQIAFIPQMHGGICFIKKGQKLDQILQLAKKIESNYSQYKFKYFNKPADEPILALSMAITGSHPIKAEPNEFVFLPTVQRLDLQKLIFQVSVTCIANNATLCGIRIVHFQNHNTVKTVYKVSRDILLKGRKYSEFILCCIYSLADLLRPWSKRLRRVLNKLSILAKQSISGLKN